MILDKAALLGAMATLRTREVHCDRLNGTVRLREWTGAQRDLFLSREDGEERGASYKGALALALSAISESGEFLFDTHGDVEALNATLPLDVLDSLAREILDLNGLSQKATKDIEGN